MEEFRAASQNVGGGGGGLKSVMESVGLGMIANQVVAAVRVFTSIPSLSNYLNSVL